MHSTGRFKSLKTQHWRAQAGGRSVQFQKHGGTPTTISTLLTLSSCIQDWQLPTLFNICKIHNCAQRHSLKTSHSFLKPTLTIFFLPASISFSVKQKGWEEQSSDFICVITTPSGVTSTTLSHNNHYTKKTQTNKNLTTKRVPALKSLQSKCYRRNCRWM